EMVRDIDEDTVEFSPNYDGRSQEPSILPSRFPNLLVNGSAGIAVGMATNIPPHNLREVADGVQWALEHPDASREELLEALLERVKGPDFPTKALIVGRHHLHQDAALQSNFADNLLALVDGVPRTLTLDQFVSHWVTHQVEVIQRRTRYRLRKAEEEAHIQRGLVKALDALDEVIALI